MRKIKFVAFALLCVLFASCDQNKGKVKDVASQFISAVSSKDKVVINDLYPNAKTYSVLQVVDSINSESIEVEYNEKDSVYIAKLNDKQSLVFKVKGENEAIITDSYGVLKLDSAAYELAAKTSAPVTKQSDMINGKLFSDEGDFISYLSEQYPNAANGNLYHSHGKYSWQGGWYPNVTIEAPVTNGGNANIKGEDYSIEFIFTRSDTGERVGTEVVSGVDIAGTETYVFHIYKKELYYYANNRILGWSTTFKFKNASTSTMLAKYGSFTGKEYDEFVKVQAKKQKK